PKRQDVLHRLLAEVMVDAEHRFLGEDLVENAVQFLCAVQIVTERLFYDDTPPTFPGRLRQPGLGEPSEHRGERGRWNREVERVVATRAAVRVEFLDRVRELVESGRIVEG